jgi:hypothetical protein
MRVGDEEHSIKGEAVRSLASYREMRRMNRVEGAAE